MHRRQFVCAGTVFLFSGLLPSVSLAVPGTGVYRGRVLAEWTGDREMKLIEPFEYVDSKSVRWPVPQGTVVDGASIPQFLWSLTGGPFEGAYRAASVVHDHYCIVRTRPHRDVHAMFWEAMLSSGVGPKRAWLMYRAVDKFGPTWPTPQVKKECEIVTEDYDFTKCTRNSLPPTRSMPKAGASDIEAFLKTVSAEADAADIEHLRETIR